MGSAMGAHCRPSWRLACALALGLLLGAVAAAARAEVVLTVEIDLRAEIEAGRFDPSRDALGLRGGHPPLSWQRPLMARPIGGGRYGLEIRFERLPFGNQPVAYKARIERLGQGPDQGWEPGRNHAIRLEAGARIAPPVPAWYHQPRNLEEMVDFLVIRIFDSLGLQLGSLRRWDGPVPPRS